MQKNTKRISMGFTLLGAALIISGCTQAALPSGNSNATTNSGNTQQPTSQRFSDQPYYSSSYLISSEPLSADAQTALSGFQMSKNALPDGTTQITLKSLKPEYKDQQYTLKPGEQLYFVEKYLQDDQNNADYNMGDDSAVIVDAQGNVVQGPQGWAQ